MKKFMRLLIAGFAALLTSQAYAGSILGTWSGTPNSDSSYYTVTEPTGILPAQRFSLAPDPGLLTDLSKLKFESYVLGMPSGNCPGGTNCTFTSSTLSGTTTNSGTIMGGIIGGAYSMAAPSGDTTGATDSAALTAAQTALTKGTIVFGAGKYYLSNIPLKNNIKYLGQGAETGADGAADSSATALILPAGSANMFVMPSGQTTTVGIGFSNCTLAGNRTSSAPGFVTTVGNYIPVTGVSVSAGVMTLTVASVPAQITTGTRLLLQGTEDALMDSEFVVSSTTATTILAPINTGFNGIGVGTNPKFNTSTGIAPYNIGISVVPILDVAAGGFAAAGGTLINLKGNPAPIATLDDFFLDNVTIRDAAIGIDSDRGTKGTAYSGYWLRNTYFMNNLIGQVVNEQPNVSDVYYQSNNIGLLGRLNDALFTAGIVTYNNYGIMPDIANSTGITFSHFLGTEFFFNYVCGGVFTAHNSFINPTLAGASTSTDQKELIFVITGDDNDLMRPIIGDSPWGSQSPVKLSGYGTGWSINNFKILGGSATVNSSYQAAPIGWNTSKVTSGLNGAHINDVTYRNTVNASNQPFILLDTHSVVNSSFDNNDITYTGTGTVLDGGVGHFAISASALNNSSVSRNKFNIAAGSAVTLINTPGLSNHIDDNQTNTTDNITNLAYLAGNWRLGQSYRNNSQPNAAGTVNKAATRARGTASIAAGQTSVTVALNSGGTNLWLPPWYLGGGASLMVPTTNSVRLVPTSDTQGVRWWASVSAAAVGDVTTLSLTITLNTAAVTNPITFSYDVDVGSGAPL
ncbi:MAG: hypothetical protein ACYC9K_00950 [Sulfuricaulis sp.]